MKYKMLLLASYCGTNDYGCTDNTPCSYCLQMCNVVEVDSSAIEYNYGGLNYNAEVNFYKKDS